MKPFDRGGLLLPRLGMVVQACGVSVGPSALSCSKPQNTFSAETLQLPILLSLMRETAAPGLVTQEPGKSVARGGALSSPPVMHPGGGHIYNVGMHSGANVCKHKHWSHAGLPYLRGVSHTPTQRFLRVQLDDLQDRGLGGFVDLL